MFIIKFMFVIINTQKLCFGNCGILNNVLEDVHLCVPILVIKNGSKNCICSATCYMKCSVLKESINFSISRLC